MNIIEKLPDDIVLYIYTKFLKKYRLHEGKLVKLIDFEKYKLDAKLPLAFRTGLQVRTGQFIIRLDADIWKYDKTKNKAVKSYVVEKLFNEMQEFNEEHYGIYSTTTCGNHAMLIDITKDKNLINLLTSYNLSKIGSGLEVIINSNAILPTPVSKCICKLHNKICQSATFWNEMSTIYEITPQLSKSLTEYVVKCIAKYETKNLTKHELRDNNVFKCADAFYDEIKCNSSSDNLPYLDNVLNMISDIIPQYMVDYNGWLYVSSCLKTSYGDDLNSYEKWDTFCKKYDGYDNIGNMKFWKSHHDDRFHIINLLHTMRKYNERELLNYLYKDKCMKNNAEYIKHRTEFEKHCWKILDPICYYDNGKLLTSTALFETYRDHKYINPNGKKFINIWLEDSDKKCYTKLVFNPNIAEFPPEHFNEFTGFPIENIILDGDEAEDMPSTSGDIEVQKHRAKYCDFIINYYKKIGLGKEKYYNYLIAWMAHLVQQPWKKIGVAIVIKSTEQGTGKNTFFNITKALFGEDYTYSASCFEDYFGRFANGRYKKLVCNCDEIDLNQSKHYLATMKEAITEDSYTYEVKGVSSIKMKSIDNWIIVSNEFEPIRKEGQDRRYFVIDLMAIHFENKTEYFDTLYKLIENKKYMRVFYDYLKYYDISNFNFKDIRTEFGDNMRYIDTMDHYLMDTSITKCVEYEDGFLKTEDGNDFIYKENIESEFVPVGNLFKEYISFIKQINNK